MPFVFDANQGTLLIAVALTDIINPAKKANSPESLARFIEKSVCCEWIKMSSVNFGISNKGKNMHQ